MNERERYELTMQLLRSVGGELLSFEQWQAGVAAAQAELDADDRR